MKRVRLKGEPPPPAVTGEESLDLIARKVLMASFLYYGLGESVISDDQFDKWCRKLAKRWDHLDEVRQWQLGGSPKDLLATAYHVRIAWATVYGALSWLNSLRQSKNRKVWYTKEPRFSKRRRLNYFSPSDFRYAEPEEPEKKKSKKRVKLTVKKGRLLK